MSENEGISTPGAGLICPNENCRFEFNRDDAMFCVLCGIMLDVECRGCKNNPPYARFCMHCGKNLNK